MLTLARNSKCVAGYCCMPQHSLPWQPVPNTVPWLVQDNHLCQWSHLACMSQKRGNHRIAGTPFVSELSDQLIGNPSYQGCHTVLQRMGSSPLRKHGLRQALMSDGLTVNQCVAITLILCVCVTGPRAGLWTVIPCQLIVMIGLDIVYCVTAGKSMQFLYQHTCHGWREHTCTSFGLSAWIVVFAAIQMLLSTVSFGCLLLLVSINDMLQSTSGLLHVVKCS